MSKLFDKRPFYEIEWLKNYLPSSNIGTKEELVELAINISSYSSKHGGGPFGAVIADKNGEIIECGCNEVILDCDSTSHAEINTIRRAQQVLNTYDLSSITNIVPFTIYVSCAPCIQCFGAIYWSGIKKVVAAALKEDAEVIGFSEGNITKETFKDATKTKGILFEYGIKRDKAKEVLKNYQGKIYWYSDKKRMPRKGIEPSRPIRPRDP